MLIGRTDDPQNPCSLSAIKVADAFGSGSRNPSGPAAVPPHQTGRTHDRFRTRSVFLQNTSCNERAVHTRATATTPTFVMASPRSAWPMPSAFRPRPRCGRPGCSLCRPNDGAGADAERRRSVEMISISRSRPSNWRWICQKRLGGMSPGAKAPMANSPRVSRLSVCAPRIAIMNALHHVPRNGV